MKIVFTISSLHVGGAERVMSILINDFVQKAQTTEVHLVLYGRKPEIFYPLSDEVIVHQPAFDFDSYSRVIGTLKTMVFLRSTISSLKADAVISFGEYWNSFVLLAGFGKKWPIYVSDRCQPNKSLGKVQDLLRNWLYPKAEGVIVQTEQAKSIYARMYQHKNICVIGNPISVVQLAPQDQRENIVLTVGRLIKSKHHSELINLFSRIKNTDWKLVIVGGDALKQQNLERLTELIAQLKLENRVILTGPIKNVTYWYQKAKIFAFTSSSEGFPNVIGEALSNGVPVVSFDCVAGPSDLVNHESNGYLVDLFDYDTFQNKLSHLMENTELREQMSANSPSSILPFQETEIANRFYSFITT